MLPRPAEEQPQLIEIRRRTVEEFDRELDSDCLGTPSIAPRQPGVATRPYRVGGGSLRRAICDEVLPPPDVPATIEQCRDMPSIGSREYGI